MLRCSISGLIPLMASDRYKDRVGEFLARHKGAFRDIPRHKSYYLLRELPQPLAAEILSPALPELIAKRRRDGLWYKSERIIYDILSAIKHAGIAEAAGTASALEDSFSFYALLIKKEIIGALGDRDRAAIDNLIASEKSAQRENGSWEDTVVGTVVHIGALIDLGLERADPAIERGVEFLFANWNEDLPGLHTHASMG